MTQDPRMQQEDPFASLSGIPAWLKQQSDPLGQNIAQFAQGTPGVQGALTGLSWLDDVFLRSPVGLAALGMDALQGGELGRSLDRTGTPIWERPKEAAHRTFGAFQQVAEDPNAPLWARGVATGARVVNLRGEILSPLAPGSGAIRGAVRGAAVGGAKGAITGVAKTLAKEAGQGTIFGQKVGSKVEGLREFGKDFATPGRPEARMLRQIGDVVREFRVRRAIPTVNAEELSQRIGAPDTAKQQEQNIVLREAIAQRAPAEAGQPVKGDLEQTLDDFSAKEMSRPDSGAEIVDEQNWNPEAEAREQWEAEAREDMEIFAREREQLERSTPPAVGTSPSNYEWKKGDRVQLGDGSLATVVEPLPNRGNVYIVRDGEKTRNLWPREKLKYAGLKVGPPGSGRVAERTSSSFGSSEEWDAALENDPELWQLFNSPLPEEEVAMQFTNMVKADAQAQVADAVLLAGPDGVVVVASGKSFRSGGIDADLRFSKSGHLLNTGDGPVPLARITEVRMADGTAVLNVNDGGPLATMKTFFSAGQEGKVTVEFALNVATGGLFGLIKKWLEWRKARQAVPTEQMFPGAPDDNVVEYVPTATQGSRTVGENAEPAVLGGVPEPSPLSVAPEGPISPGGPGRPPQFGPGVPEQAVTAPVPGSSSAELAMRMAPQSKEPVFSLADELTSAPGRQGTRMKAIVKKVNERRAITGEEALQIVKGLERSIEDGTGDVTITDLNRIKKSLEPVIQAQALYNSVKDVNNELAEILRVALRVAEKERDRLLRERLGVNKSLQSVEGRVAEGEKQSAQRLVKIQQEHDQRVARINTSVDVALTKMAEGEADAIVRALSDLDAAVANIEVADVRRLRLSKADAERLARRGYLSEPNKVVLEELHFNTGMHHPVVAKVMSDAILANRAAWEARPQNISTAQSAQDASRYVGVSPKELEAEARARGLDGGDLTAFMFGLRLSALDQTRKLKTLTKSGASADEIAKAYTEYQEFLLHVGGAKSELGRALVSQRVAITGRLRDAYKQREVGGLVRQRIMDVGVAHTKAAEQVALIQAKYDSMLSALGDRTKKALDAANQKLLTNTKAELDAAMKKRTDLEKQLETLRTAETNAVQRLRDAVDEVRGTAAQKMVADGGTIDDLKAIIEQSGDDIDRLAMAVRNLNKITNGDRAVAYMTNNLFSGIASQEANALGSLFRVVGHFSETAAAEQFGRLYTSLTGNEAAVAPGETGRMVQGVRNAFTRGTGSGETMEQKWTQFRGKATADTDIIVASQRGIPKGFEVWIDTMLKGHSPAGMRAAELARPTVWGHGKAGLAFEFFNRLNGAFDAVGRHVLQSAETQALYIKHARTSLVKELTDQGIPVTAETLTPEMLMNRFDEMLNDPPEGIWEQAMHVANKSTYAGKYNPFTEKVLGVIGHRFDVPGLGEAPVGRVIFAASRFTWAATVYSLETTPLGILKAGNRLRQARAAGAAGKMGLQEEMSREAARMGARGTAGLVATVWAMNAFADGTLIGKDPENRGRDDSIKIGDTYIPLKYAWPLTAPLIYTAHVMDKVQEGQMKEDEWPVIMLNAGLGWADALGNQPVLRTISDIMGAVRYGGDQVPRLFARYTSRVVPYSSFIRDVTQMIDAIDRDPRGSLVDMWKENLPLLSMQVNPKVDRWGDPVVNKPEGLIRALPFQSMERAANPADNAIVKLQKAINPLTKKPWLGAISAPEDHIGGIELDQSQHSAWQTIAGTFRKEALINLVQSDRFIQADPKVQAALIKSHNDHALTEAKRAYAAELMSDRNTDAQLKGVRIGISVTEGNYQRVKLVEKVLPILDANPDMQKAFDQYRQSDDLTLAQYRQALLYLPLWEQQPEFSSFSGAPIGTEEQWKAYHEALRQYNQLNKDGRKNEARIFLSRNTVLRRYMALAKRPGGKNAVITRMKAKYPVLRYIVMPGQEDDDTPELVRNPLAQARAF